MARSDDNFVARWSRLKRGEQRKRRGGAAPVLAPAEGEATPGVDTQAEPVVDEAVPTSTSGGHESPAPVETAKVDAAGEATEAATPVEELPPIDSLDKDSDYTGFLKEGVPEDLQRLALRRLWRSNPIFGFRDGLNDYDEDFTIAAGAVEAVKTIYKVGKGMVEDDDATPEAEPDAVAEGEGDGDADADAPRGPAADAAEDADESAEGGDGSGESDAQEAPEEAPGRPKTV